MQIEGKKIRLRCVTIDDAEFIVNMRQQSDKTKYLSKITGGISAQRKWIEEYKTREAKGIEYYFVIESKKGEKLGLVRIYDFQKDSFCWGSWLIKDGAPISTAIESALQVYELGFYRLHFDRSHFEVRKGNDKVIAFHKRFGAEIVDEDERDCFFILTKEQYIHTKKRYERYL